MLKHILSKKRSVIFTWLISYIMVLLIPVLITTIAYVKTANVVENEINNSNALLLKKIQQQMDGLLRDVESLSQEIAFNTRVNDLLRVKGTVNDVDPFNIYQIIRDLRTYKMPKSFPNSLIDDLYIYFRSLDYVISSSMGNHSKSFFDIYIESTGISYEQWMKIAAVYHKGEFITLHNSGNKGPGSKKIAFIMTIPPINQGSNYANLFILLDESKFMEDARYIESLNKGTVLILNKENKVLFSSKSVDGIENLKYENLKNENDILFHEKVGLEKVVISCINSQRTDWKYIAVVPESIFWEKVQYVRRLTVVSLLFCLVIGGFITYLSLKKNYNPVSKLVKVLEKYQGQEFNREYNEFSFIQQAFDKVRSEKEKADTVIKQQNRALKTELLTRLLKGKEIGGVTVEDSLLLHNIQFLSDYFAVIVFYIEDFSEMFFARKASLNENDSFEDFKMAQFVITNVVEELVGQKNQGFMADVDDMLVCLVNFKENPLADGKNELKRIVDKSRKFIGECFNVDFVAAISDIHETIAGIPEAYRQALQAMEYKRILGIEDIVCFEDIKVLPKGDFYYPLEVEQQLINNIKAGNFDRSKALLDTIFQKNFKESVLSLKVARCLMFDLVSTMLKTVNEITGIRDNDFLEELNPMDRLLNCQRISEMKCEMVNLLSLFCKYIENRNKSRNKKAEYQLVKSVMDYIENNYWDINLSGTTIAEYFSIHPVYLSKIFKEQSGEGLLDYINRKRINKAKHLFKEHPGNLDEIANRVGYSNKHTFIRIFKKYEGITPGKFRES